MHKTEFHISDSIEEGLKALQKLFIKRLQAFETDASFSEDVTTNDVWATGLLAFLPVKKVTYQELIFITLALAAHIRPHFFDRLIQQVYPGGGDFPHLGGIRGKGHRGFLPTGETALFLLAGDNLKQRFALQKLFDTEHWFAKKQILSLSEPERNEPIMSGQLILDREIVEKITFGKVSKPTFSSEFPASLITTQLAWGDLVLPQSTRSQIQDIFIWLKHSKALMVDWAMEPKIKPGYRALFYGQPGTGKTLTANLLGKYIGRDVYRVDLSTVISKYIGETEKNLSNLFNRAENKDWILFFDEADALFGKRTQVQNAHDRYANQEVAYLLQRVESYGGLVILASNFRSNIDDAFTRRFQSIIHFPMPKPAERLQLWQNAFPDKIELDKNLNLKQLSQKYALSGADIMNVVQYVSLRALARDTRVISLTDICAGIDREMVKSGKIS